MEAPLLEPLSPVCGGKDCQKLSEPSVTREGGKRVSQALVPLPLVPSGMVGGAALLQGHYKTCCKTTTMEETPQPGSPQDCLPPRIGTARQPWAHPQKTACGCFSPTVAAERLFKSLATPTMSQKRSNRYQSCCDWFGKVLFPAQCHGWLAGHLLKWLIFFLFKVSDQADSVPQPAKSALTSQSSEDRSSVGRQVGTNSSPECCLFLTLHWQPL